MKAHKYGLKTIFEFDEDTLEEMGIPPIEKIEDETELWKFVNLDRHSSFNKERRYLVSTHGRVYDLKNEKLLTLKSIGAISSNGFRYKSVSITICGKSYTYLVHRLVALAFIPIVKDRPLVNHKDGCPEHNNVWNLEWVNNQENCKHAYDIGLGKIGEKRSNALWTDNEIRFICSLIEDGHKATYIYHTLAEILKDPKVEYERVRTLYKHIIHKTHWIHISKEFNIDHTPYNYLKEQSSVKKAKKRKNKLKNKLKKGN